MSSPWYKGYVQSVFAPTAGRLDQFNQCPAGSGQRAVGSGQHMGLAAICSGPGGAMAARLPGR
jgi:hypothetical protein